MHEAPSISAASCRRPVIAISADEGVTWTEHVIGPEGWNGYPELAVAVDDDGAIYGLWVSTDRLPYLATSVDGGSTWTPPVLVAAPGVTEVNLVVLEAGAGGRVAIGALVSTDAPAGIKPPVAVECRLGPCTDAVFYEDVTWHAEPVVDDRCPAQAPTFVSAILNDPASPIVRGACGPGRCKSNADFTDLVIDSAGQPWMAFVACPDGECPTRPTGGWWGSSTGMLGTVDGVSLRESGLVSEPAGSAASPVRCPGRSRAGTGTRTGARVPCAMTSGLGPGSGPSATRAGRADPSRGPA